MQNPFVAGIVAEYNPFHLGHIHMITKLRDMGAESVVCVLGGPFMQRGEAAFLPTAVRAKAALLAGVDLVLRLPLSWATASAERFAQGGINMLAALGCVQKIAFGAECANLKQLESVANALICDDFTGILREELKKSVSFAGARAAACEKICAGASEIISTPNNILAVEYIKAIKCIKPNAHRQVLQPLAIQRKGAKHDGRPLDGVASASWLRREASIHGIATITPYVPKQCMPVYENAYKEGAVVDPLRFETAILARLRGGTAEYFSQFAGTGEGLEKRLEDAAKAATTLDEIYTLAKSKRFAHSRVRRFTLACALQIKPCKDALPPFAQVLAANSRGLELLGKTKKAASIPISTSLAKLAKTGEFACVCVQTEAVAEDFYAFCLAKPQKGGAAFTQPVFVDR